MTAGGRTARNPHREAIHVDSGVVEVSRGRLPLFRLIQEVAHAVQDGSALVYLDPSQPVGAVADDQACPGVDRLAREVFEELGRLVAVVARLMAVDRQHDDFGRRASAADLREDPLDVARIRNEIHRRRAPLLDVRAEQGELIAAGLAAALQRRRRTPQRLVGLRVDGDVGDISERVDPRAAR